MKADLAREFKHGATPVGTNCGATDSTLPDLFTKSAFGDKPSRPTTSYSPGTVLSKVITIVYSGDTDFRASTLTAPSCQRRGFFEALRLKSARTHARKSKMKSKNRKTIESKRNRKRRTQFVAMPFSCSKSSSCY